MSNSRAELYAAPFRYILVLVIVGMIALFGAYGVLKLRESACRTHLVTFHSDVAKAVESLSADVGSARRLVLDVPCDIYRLYFVDVDQDPTPFLRSVPDQPVIADAVASGTKENLFLVSNSRLVRSFYLPSIELHEPYFLCSDASSGKVELILEGVGDGVRLRNADCRQDCTFEHVQVNESVAKEIIQATLEFGCRGCPRGTLDDEMQAFNATNGSIRIARRCNCGTDDGKTSVEIRILPDGTLRHLKLIERIPKDAVEDLDAHLADMTGAFQYTKIKSDPLIVWHFNEISEETTVSYTLDFLLAEHCTEILDAVGLAVTPESESLPEDRLDDPPADNPIMFDIPIHRATVQAHPGERIDVFEQPVWEFLADADITDSSAFSTSSCELSDGGGYGRAAGDRDAVECTIDAQSHIICDIAPTFSGTHIFHARINSSPQLDDLFAVEVTGCAEGESRPCPNQQGVCSGSEQTCTENAWPECDYAATAGHELTEQSCGDGQDNDCDGITDCADDDCPDGTRCGQDKACHAGACVDLTGELTAAYSNLRKNAGNPPPGFPGTGYDWWYYDMTVAETSDLVGLTVTSRQKCYESRTWGTLCDPPKADIPQWFGTDYLAAGQSLSSITPNYAWIGAGDVVTLTETFYGNDEFGNALKAAYSLALS